VNFTLSSRSATGEMYSLLTGVSNVRVGASERGPVGIGRFIFGDVATDSWGD